LQDSPKGVLQASVHHATLLNPYNEDGSYARYGIFDNIYALIENNDIMLMDCVASIMCN
jgi:hypothetical protein